MQELAIDSGSYRACPANNVLHRIAARLRIGMNLKGFGWGGKR